MSKVTISESAEATYYFQAPISAWPGVSLSPFSESVHILAVSPGHCFHGDDTHVVCFGQVDHLLDP